MNKHRTNMQNGGGRKGSSGSATDTVGVNQPGEHAGSSNPNPPGHYSELALTCAYRLTKTALPNEDTVRDELSTLLRELSIDRQIESKVPSGSVDIFLPNRNFVIEVKDQNEVGPNRDGSKEGETQLGQLMRYISGMAERQRRETPLMILQPEDHRWKGLLTDGRTCFYYSFQVTSEQTLIKLDEETRSFVHTPPGTLCGWLENRINSTNTKVRLPEDPTGVAGIFQNFEPELRRLYTKLSRKQSTRTKHRLWLEMNRGSGFNVDDSDTDLFVDHTLLTNAAEAVIASLGGGEKAGTEVVADGFASWPQDRDRNNKPTSTVGAEWTNQLFQTVYDYDWLGRDRDVLRHVYEGVIKREHRKAFGEYYTPDWLAELVVNEVLDDDWCERAVKAALESGDAPIEGIGMLDPACGSGTFLYHAARRLQDSDGMKRQHLEPLECARVVAKLVNGIDVHPIAVSIARATLMRALPPDAGLRPDELNVFHGDSLAVRQSQGIKVINENPQSPYAEVISPNGTAIPVPHALAGVSDFNTRLTRMVRSAHNRQALPDGIVNGLVESDQDIVRKMHEALIKVCNEEGNSVWVWYLTNQMATYTLINRGVDRVVANPPWVVMSDIQVAERKSEMENLVDSLDIGPGGKNAAAFDIAGAFVKRCRQLYLKSEHNAAGWVLNWSALSGSNWLKTREDQRQFNRVFIDLSKVREKPFSGASACVWIQSDTDAPIETRIYRNNGNIKVCATDSATEFARKTTWSVAADRFPVEPSGYIQGGNRSFSSGARLAPQCLILVRELKEGTEPDTAFVVMQKSQQDTWKDVAIQSGEVPSQYVREAVLSSRNLWTFSLSPTLTTAILPLNASGEPDLIQESGSFECRDPFWRNLDTIYRDKRGIGGYTPATLWDRLTFGGGLQRQLRVEETGDELIKVAYNSSGHLLRAARMQPTSLVDDGCYYLVTETENEAAYLAAMLNSPCLQLAFQQAQKSDRHFHQHIWNDVPIPLFDETDQDHVALAALTVEAEAIAAQVAQALPPKTGQIKASNAIRRELRVSQVAGRIDDVVRRIMPSHSVSVYDETVPHPWRYQTNDQLL